jgi:hypothetical protein
MKVQIGSATLNLGDCEICKQTAKQLTECIPNDHIILITPDINCGIRTGWHLHRIPVGSTLVQRILDRVSTGIQWAKDNIDIVKNLS